MRGGQRPSRESAAVHTITAGKAVEFGSDVADECCGGAGPVLDPGDQLPAPPFKTSTRSSSATTHFVWPTTARS